MSQQVANASLDEIVSLCKRRGFVYQSADIYGGLNGVYDFGHYGVLINQNIRSAWLKSLYKTDPRIVQLDGSLLGPAAVWDASGHTQNFNDPLVDCTNCKHRFRADEISLEKPCSNCGVTSWTDVRQFNMMFKTELGASVDSSSIAYLRPETAQTVFINFKHVLTTNRVKIPFGIAQIGKAFRNEITPKQFLFRVREFEQMEVEWFCKPENTQTFFSTWLDARTSFFSHIGLSSTNIRQHEQSADERAHYSSRTVDIEYQFPFGWREIEGIADRGDFDLTQHMTHSKKDLRVFDDATKSSYVPHVVECSVGIGRLFLALICDAYKLDKVEGEQRTVLALDPHIAPIKAAILPLSKKLAEPAQKLFANLNAHGIQVEYDESGSIGKRYRRQDEIGTPICITYDFESEQDHCVTVRDRDTTKQTRISLDKINTYLNDILR